MATATYRDEWGIPHLWGDSVDELAFAQGRNAALDRTWQIELEHWRSEGRLAERLGAAELGWDRFARRARLDDTARRCYARLDPDTRRWVDAYVAGVNDGLTTAQSPEFGAVGCAPEAWQPWTPLGVFIVQHVLFGTFPNKLWRAHVEATLGPDALGLFAVEGPGGSGSNAWAVAGPGAFIAGDPHRVLELPGIYQQIRLACPEFDVVGLAFPGVPGVPHFGHAGGVAWAVTNAMADYQDLYREELRRVDGRIEVREATGWAVAQVHTEQITVYGQPPDPVVVVETARGPIVDVDRTTGEGISLRTPTRVEADLGFGALLPLLRSRTVDDVAAALRRWVEPVNSVLVADTTGAVLRLVAGLVPVRDGRCHQTPVPAWHERYRWQDGYAPLPRTPIATTAVTANDRRTGDVAELGTDFAPPHRARRIGALLDGGAAPDVVHGDDHLAAGVLRDLLGRLTSLSGPAGELRDRLLDWDGRLHADSVDAGAFAAWRGALARGLHDHPSLRPLLRPGAFDGLFAPWTDPRARIGHALDGVVAGLHRLGGDVDPVAAAALDEVARAGEAGPWGERHRLHPVRLPAEPAFDALRVPLSGDTDCVLSTASVPGVANVCWRGPVARYVWDLADRSASRWVVPFGASGRPGDPHFADQLPRWAAGELIAVLTDWSRLTRELPDVYAEDLPGLGRLRLVPVDPGRDAALLHGWVTQPRATFWGMGSYTVDGVREVYAFIDGLATHHAYLIRLDDAPVGIFQTYEPAADPVGERYPVRPGDIGMHVLLAASPGGAGDFTAAVGGAVVRFLFSDAGRQRVVVEPDVRNQVALRRLANAGFTFAGEIDMPDKRAQLAFLTRETFENVAG